MAFGTPGYDPNETNQALQTLGSSYQLPAQQPAPMAAPVAQARDPEVPGIQSPDAAAKGGSMAGTMGGVQEGASALGSMTNDTKKKDGMQKLGGLIGMVLGAYTGNPQAVAGGASAMKDQ